VCGPRFYKRMAKPRKVVPQSAARPRTALGMVATPALLLLLLKAPEEPVDWVLPEPEVLDVPEAVERADEVVGMEVLPR
jgi:hypothetical protein